MLFSKVTGKMNFGLLSAFAARDGYSVSYYKRAHAKKLANLGRVSGAQGKPGLRCSMEFLHSFVSIARAVRASDERMDTFFVDQNGIQIAAGWETKPPDYVRFIVERDHVYVVEVSLSGMLYNIDNAPMMLLSGAE